MHNITLLLLTERIVSSGALRDILIAKAWEVVHFILSLRICFSPVWWSATTCGSRIFSRGWISRGGATWRSSPCKFLAPFARSWRDHHLVEVLRILLGIYSSHCRILFIRWICLCCSYLIFEPNLTLHIIATVFETFFFKRGAMPLLSVYGIHWIKGILDLLILLSAHVLGLSILTDRTRNGWLSSNTSWKFKVEIDTGSKLVDVDSVFGRLVNVCCSSHEPIIAWTCAHRWTHCSS